MALRSDGQRTKKRILQTCVRLFLENGYTQTTLQQICREAQVSTGSFFNLFGSKDGVLKELLSVMFRNQFALAQSTAGGALPPVYEYAVETAIQITLTELNGTLRDIYLEVYTRRELLDIVQSRTAGELHRIFGPYQPELTKADFLALEYCTGGMMRGCMANPCTADIPLEKKLHTFISLALRAYRVPEELIGRVLTFVAGLDIRDISRQVMEKLLTQLAMQYDLSAADVLPGA